MSLLDEIFKNPQPEYKVNLDLYRLYMQQTLYEATMSNKDTPHTEAELVEKLKSCRAYVCFLNKLNNLVVQEISDVDNQLEESGAFGPTE